MSANVARLRPDGQPEPAPALGMSIQVDLGAGRVCTLQTHVANDCSLQELNGLLDKMTTAGDRQRAHYQLEELNATLLKQEKELVQLQADYDQHKAAFNVTQAKRTEDVAKQTLVVANFEKAKREARAQGRRGDVELKGADAANVATLTKSVEALKQQVLDADQAYATDCANFENNLKVHAKAIERTKREVARCEGIVKAASGE